MPVAASISTAAARLYRDRAGSQLDVSGTATELDLPNGNQGFITRSVASDAGSITFAAAEGMVLDGAMHCDGRWCGRRRRSAADYAGCLQGTAAMTSATCFDFPNNARSIRVVDGDSVQVPEWISTPRFHRRLRCAQRSGAHRRSTHQPTAVSTNLSSWHAICSIRPIQPPVPPARCALKTVCTAPQARHPYRRRGRGESGNGGTGLPPISRWVPPTASPRMWPTL